MASVLKQLDECSRMLASDKVTERKKSMESLPFLMKNATVLGALDKNSDRRDGLTWDILFSSVKNCVNKEVEQLEKDSQKVAAASSTVLANRDRKKKVCASLVRLVISNANSRGEIRLKTANVIDHLLSVMRREFTWNCFAVDYSNILLKEVLSHRRIARNIRPSDLDEFFLVYTSWYKSSKSDSNHGLVMQILEVLFRLGYHQTFLNASLLFTFFNDVFRNCRSTLGLTQQERLMATCLIFCKAVAVDCRHQLCYFGENVLGIVLSMLGDKLSEHFKAIVVEFLQLQMACHHPKGAVTEASGMLYCDGELWQRHLHRLYEVLLKEIQQPAFRSRYSAKSVGLDADFLWLFADVFHQEISVLKRREEEPVREEGESSCPVAKRRKVARGFSLLTDNVQNIGSDTENVIAWLQVMDCLLKKYPDSSVSVQEIVSVVQVLQQLQMDCKRYSVMASILNCFHPVLHVFCCYQRVGKYSDLLVDCVASWTKIYDHTVRMVSLNHCICEGHSLIQKLIASHVIEPGPELRCLFTAGINFPSQSSLCTLVALMNHSSVQKMVLKRWLWGGARGHDDYCSPLKCRLQLFDWLLPSLMEESSPSHFKGSDRPSITLLGRTLAKLVVQDVHMSPEAATADIPESHSLETFYLQASFDWSPVCADVESGTVDIAPRKLNVIWAARTKLIEYLLRDCGILLDSALSPESQDIMTISGQCCLVAKCVGQMVTDKTVTLEELIPMRICDVLQKLMARLCDLLRSFCYTELHSKTKLHTVMSVISNLCEMFTWEGTADFCGAMSQFCREMSSEGLIDTLIDCLYGKILMSGETKLPSNSSESVDFDTDFDIPSNGDMPSPCDLTEQEFSPYYSCDRHPRTSGVTSDEAEQRIEVDTEYCQLGLVRLLTTWCRYPRHPLLSPLRPKAAAKTSAAALLPSVVDRILKPFLEDTFDLERQINAHLGLSVLDEFTKLVHTLSSMQLSDFLQILRRICKIYFKDGDMSVKCLNILASFLLKLNDFYVKNNFEGDLSLRDHAFHVLNGFWVCKSKGNVGPYTELAIAKTIAALAKCDSRLWQLNVVGNGVPDGNLEFLPPSSKITLFLKSKTFLVSHFVSSCIPTIFQSGLLISASIVSLQKKLLDSVVQSVNDAAITTDGSFRDLKQVDLLCNCTSSSIAVLSQIATCSSFCRADSLFVMCRYAEEVPSMHVSKIKKALKLISVSLKYPSVTGFLDAHMAYLIYCCITKAFDLSTFIWRLTDIATLQEFYVTYHKIIAPLVFVFEKTDLQEPLVNAVGSSWPDLVTKCFPEIMAFFIPGYVSLAANEVVSGDKSKYIPSKFKADMIHRHLEEMLTKEAINELLASRLSEVVVSLLSCLCCSHLEGDTSIVLPSTNPLSYDLDVVSSALNYIMTACDEPHKSLISVLCKTEDGLQKILMALEIRLEGSHLPYNVYQATIAYKLFVSLIWKEFSCRLHKLSGFVMQDVVCTLTRLLKRARHKELQIVALECCHSLREVAETAISTCSREFVKLAPLIVNTLIFHVQENDLVVAEKAISLIEFLVVEHGDFVKENLVYMEPFPDSMAFEAVREVQSHWKYGNGQLSLKKEIEHFLNGLEVNGSCQRPEGLRLLCTKLVSNREELKNLFQELRGFRFADEYSDNVLYCLFNELLHLCSECHPAAEIVMEAVHCLGEFGPLSLASPVLQPKKANPVLSAILCEFDGDPVAQRNVVILHKLHTYLSDTSIHVKVVSSQVLKNILSSFTGLGFADRYKSKNVYPLFNYLLPFCSKKAPTVAYLGRRLSNEEFSNAIDTSTLWSPDLSTFEKYICGLCCSLIDTGVYDCEILRQLRPICEVKVDFCKELLPYLLHSILLADDCGTFHKIISRQINGFFAKFAGALEGNYNVSASRMSTSDALGPIYLDRCAIQVLLNVIQFLRLQKKPKSSRSKTVCSPWEDNFMLDLDYLFVAMAAHYSSAHFTALLFVEIWCEVKIRKLVTGSQSGGSKCYSRSLSVPSASYISNLSICYPDHMQAMQNLLLKIYCCIGDPDAVYGCQTAHLSDASIRLQYYEHERRWDRAVMSYDLACRGNADMLQPVGMPRTLFKLGLQHLSQMYIENLWQDTQSTEVRELQFECAWKTTHWNESSAENWLDDCDSAGFNELLYGSLCALPYLDEQGYRDLCVRAYRAVILDLAHDGVECASGLSRPLTSLLTLRNLEDYFEMKRCYDGDVHEITAKWSARDVVVQRDFDAMEPVLSMRSALLQLMLLPTSRCRQDAERALIDCEKEFAKMARENGLFQCAENHVSRMKEVSNSVFEGNFLWMLEEAKLFWDRSEHDTAKSLMKVLIKDIEQKDKHDISKLYAQTLSTYGNWLIETRSESVSNVMENYLEKAICLLETYEPRDEETSDSLMSSYLTTARYADAHYRRTYDYLKSSACESKHQMIRDSKEGVHRLKEVKVLSEDQRKSYHLLMKQSEIDSKELEMMHHDRLRFLVKAVENYLKCLALGATEDKRMFRLVALWFQNKDCTEVNSLIQELGANVTSHKFLPLVYQLAARLGSGTQAYAVFQKILRELIERITVDHPHHALLVILALSNATKDKEYSGKRTEMVGKRRSSSNKTEETNRICAATEVLNKVRSGRLAPLVADMEKLCVALISFSYWSPPNVDNRKNVNVPLKISADQPLNNVVNLERVPPVTLNLKIDPSCNYDSVPGILEYFRNFQYVGGVNSPKKVCCRGSDGVVHTQLVKGNDDLRQDAVMQQVFGMVNSLLVDNPETAQRNLLIRTYKVVPLSQRSGVLEWCINTIPFGSYLVDGPSSKGAHSRYFPADKTVAECRKQMGSVANKSFKIKCDMFNEVCRQLRPVFRHFFLENFPQPQTWFERRTAYVKSVATTSIVGYILGLGDRHVSNILVDMKTAEFIHIDLGIAFEQGRNLATPETVPFRLTRDVVDGMGITGTEGTFRRCCEKTMTVMRSAQEVVLTILQVLLYDPLYHWSVTPLKAEKIQRRRDLLANSDTIFDTNSFDGTSVGETSFANDVEDCARMECPEEDINKLAERALYRVQEKLRGTEDGMVLSVSGQVSHLINEAKDSMNLCKLFQGWQAYL